MALATVIERGNALQIPYPDASFDVVHAHQVLQHRVGPGGVSTACTTSLVVNHTPVRPTR